MYVKLFKKIRKNDFIYKTFLGKELGTLLKCEFFYRYFSKSLFRFHPFLGHP